MVSMVKVPSPDVNAIKHTHSGFRGRNIRANLCHDADEGHLPDIGAFPSHIRTRDYHNSPAITLEKESAEKLTHMQNKWEKCACLRQWMDLKYGSCASSQDLFLRYTRYKRP